MSAVDIRAAQHVPELLTEPRTAEQAVTEQPCQPLPFTAQVDLQHVRLDQRLEARDPVRPRIALANHPGAGASLEQEIVLPIRQLLMGKDVPDAHHRLNRRLGVVRPLPPRPQQRHRDPPRAAQGICRHCLVPFLEDVQGQHRLWEQHNVWQRKQRHRRQPDILVR
jgi:hypothetical protein